MRVQDIIKITKQKKVKDMASTVLINLRFLYTYSPLSQAGRRKALSILSELLSPCFVLLKRKS